MNFYSMSFLQLTYYNFNFQQEIRITRRILIQTISINIGYLINLYLWIGFDQRIFIEYFNRVGRGGALKNQIRL